jgi:hypothetical protein
MGTFRGLICNNENDYRQKERLIHDKLYADFSQQVQDGDGNSVEKGEYTSTHYSGSRGVADIYTVDGKPILVEPNRKDWADEMKKLPLNFQDLDTSIIKREEE